MLEIGEGIRKMHIAKFEVIPVSVPYTHREVSSQVHRDGVTDVLVRLESDDGLVGWGEACSGGDTETICAVLRAMAPFVLNRDPSRRAQIRSDIYHRGLWNFQQGSANFGFAGIDMALLDIWGKALGQPAHALLGGAVRDSVNYFYYLSRGSATELEEQCRSGLAKGYSVYYLKTGIDEREDLEMVRTVRTCLGSGPILRLDSNGAWTVPQARRMFSLLQEFDIDFVEQPVCDTPPHVLAELGRTTKIAICANEGLWSERGAYERISTHQADVFCFSPHWVGGSEPFLHLAKVAEYEGREVCKHTHGELGIGCAAVHQLLLTIPNLVEGNQQTASMLSMDVLSEPLPIVSSPEWGLPREPGIGVIVEEDAVREASERYASVGQYLPYEL